MSLERGIVIQSDTEAQNSRQALKKIWTLLGNTCLLLGSSCVQTPGYLYPNPETPYTKLLIILIFVIYYIIATRVLGGKSRSDQNLSTGKVDRLLFMNKGTIHSVVFTDFS